MVPPEGNGDEETAGGNEEKAGEGFRQSDANVSEEVSCGKKFPPALENAGRAAEDKSV